MGYTSEVAIRCGNKAFEMFMKAINKHKFMPTEIYKDEEYNEYLLYWDCVKWYGMNPEIMDIEYVMDDLDNIKSPESNEDMEYAYSFVRMGEEITDIERRENDYDIFIDIQRTISIPETMKML